MVLYAGEGVLKQYERDKFCAPFTAKYDEIFVSSQPTETPDHQRRCDLRSGGSNTSLRDNNSVLASDPTDIRYLE